MSGEIEATSAIEPVRVEPDQLEPKRDPREFEVGVVSRVFVFWSLRHEATRWQPALLILLPLLLAGVLAATTWPRLGVRFEMPGRTAMRHLFWVAALTIGFGGIQYASKAVCWELSREMRDIVRMTSLNAQTLLWTKTLTRWGTIGWSLLLLLPLAMLACTLGGVTRDQLLAAACGLALVAALAGSIAMLAGVLTCNSQNPEKMATNFTGTILVIYNFAFPAASQAVYWGYRYATGEMTPSVQLLCTRITLCSPSVSASQMLTSPGLFSPLDLGYWLHFVTAACCAGMASLAIHFKWKGDLSDGPFAAREADSGRPSSAKSAVTGRPRCSDHPFFWKDVYILSDERKWVNTWSLFYGAALIGIVALNVLMFQTPDYSAMTVVVSIVSLIAAALVVSVRFDALLTAEFRDRTWGSLMLLPVEPCDLLLTKLWAALWEQRFAMLPVGAALISLVSAPPQEAFAVGMAAVLAPLACGLLCQMSCINQLLGKKWWVGPVQAVAFIAVLVGSIALWSVCGVVAGFAVTTVLLLGVCFAVHYAFVQPLARSWSEP